MAEAIVVGAGIGGLTAAIGLLEAGIDVSVVERAQGLQPVGAGLTIQPNAVIALDRLGIGDAVRAVGTHLEAVEIRTSEGGLLASLGPADAEALRLAVGAPALGIHRATLQELLVEALPTGTIEFDRTVTAVRRRPQDAEVSFADGTTSAAGIVVGADGLRSRVREALVGAVPPRYAGYFCWRGVTEKSPFPPDWSGEFWGRGRRFGGCAIDGGRLYWFAVAAGPAGGSDPRGAHSAVTGTFADFTPAIRQAIADTDPDAVFRTDIADRPPVSTWGSGRVTLLGDAAHAMTPNLGQGACHAIEDSLVLSAQVRRSGVAPAALRAYEQQRIPRANATVKAAWRMGRIAQLSGAGAATRNMIVRAVPSRVLRRQLGLAWTLPY